ncbi:tungstate ABC transporter substrate-binding protein WtpA [Methanofollis aquaemaris]|uniref:Tungstate ABC transporter substrate-binding protein WtpA n=1 Tax=Methanofollis aquaemaris TaxID=126734 RepID=A0A8A3S481_9EURY|nr:tungstate ABC transporter substrate-binding protein WtpA [Methanofollis aquaemaris]QSZ66551.1 tungstate ABC transporter substrate-binding protein WtpA [Methanofollis aquaemaris]
MRGTPLVLLALVAVFAVAAGCTGGDNTPTTLRVVPAGSLLLPMEEVEVGFEASHPGVDVQIEGHGSIQCVRQVTDLHRDIDVVVVADEALIPDMMYRSMKEGEGNYTDSYTPFATNQMVVAYTNHSLYADEITSENWYEVLARPDVVVGISNPMLDAAGYRSLMVTTLAEDYYGNDSIYDAILGDHLKPALEVSQEGSVTVITLPEVLKAEGEMVRVRDGSIYLLSLLDAGGVDYAFEYLSVAEGHGLQYVTLPTEIDLSSAAYADDYEKAVVKLGFQRFGSIGSERVGNPIVYAATVPNTAPHPNLAREFMDYMIVRFSEGPGEGWPSPL